VFLIGVSGVDKAIAGGAEGELRLGDEGRERGLNDDPNGKPLV
jgi:hypothetical protein